jgi:hypothetical protein
MATAAGTARTFRTAFAGVRARLAATPAKTTKKTA